MPDVRVAAISLVHHHQRVRVAFGEILWPRRRHVQNEIARAARAQGSHQQRSPMRLRGSAAQVHIAGEEGAIHEVTMPIGAVRQQMQVRDHAARNIGQGLVTGAGRKPVQHAVVGSHVDHLGPVPLRQREIAVRLFGLPRRGLADIPDL